MKTTYIISRIIPCLVLAMLGAITARAYGRAVHRLDVSSGLANGYVRAIAQDHAGYVWVATNDGLSRFDGHGFTNYNTDNSGLSGNELNSLAVCPADSTGLYIATQRNGLCRYDTRTGLIEKVENPNLRSPDITWLAPARDGGLWLSHYHFGVQHLDPATGNMRNYDFTSLPGFPLHTWTVAEGPDGRVYTGHIDGGMSVIDPASNSFVRYTHDPANPSSLPGNSVYTICMGPNGAVWIGTDGGAALLNTSTGKITRFVNDPANPCSISPGRVWTICPTAAGEIWMGTSQGGVSILDAGSYAYTDISRARFRRLPIDGSSGSISSPYVYSLFQDSFGNMWIGHFRAGIDVADHLEPFFTRVNYISSGPDRFTYLPVWNCVFDERGCVWIGAENELVRSHRGNLQRASLPGNFVGARTFIYHLAVDDASKVWMATSEQGVLVFDPATCAFSSIEGVPHDVRTILRDDSGRMLLGTVSGLFVYDHGTLAEAKEINSLLVDHIIQALAYDRFGRLWVGTFGKGISVFDTDGDLLATFNRDNGFTSNAINEIKCDSKGNIWAATRSGLVRFAHSREMPQPEEISELRSAGVSHVMAIEEDRQNKLWLSTNRGIAHVDPDSREVSLYQNSDDMPLNSFFERGSAVDDSGLIYFASNNGLVSLDPKVVYSAVEQPSVALTSFTVLTEGRHKKETEIAIHPVAGEPIVLPYGQNTFRISFNVLDHSMARRTDFAYNMEGVDDTWTETTGDNHAIYRNLPPGSYRFRVRQRLKGARWGEPSVIAEITVKPPFYLTWWAKALYFLMFAGIVYLCASFYRRRFMLRQKLKAKMAEAESRQRLNEERLRFYTNITHELRTPLTLILGPLEDMVSDPALPSQYSYKLQMIRENSNTLLSLINGILEFRKTETQNRRLNVKKGRMSQLVREIGLRFKELNRNPEVEIIIDVDGDDDTIYFDREMLTIILNNLLSNAVKYTPKGRITLSYHIVPGADRERRSVISVADTGYGIAREGLAHIFDRYYQVNGAHQASGTGIGLALVKSLADLHHAEISVDSVEHEGSTFTISFLTDCTYPEALHGDETTPAAPDAEEDAEPKESDAAPKILVVEDNDDIREYIATTLSAEFEVITARNGLGGLQAVQTHHPDIVISDIMMPEMDGVELCRIIKDDILTSHIPVILLTAKDALRDKEEGYAAGADSYLTKPFSAKLLQGRIHNLLRSRRRLASALLSQSKAIGLPPPENFEEPVENVDDAEEISSSLNPLDRQFLDKILEIINSNLALEDLGVAFLADKMCMSSSTLYRKIMAILGISTNEYIRRIRLTRAAEMLAEGGHSITDIAYATGFSSHSSFAKAFKKEYGMTASEYAAKS